MNFIQDYPALTKDRRLRRVVTGRSIRFRSIRPNGHTRPSNDHTRALKKSQGVAKEFIKAEFKQQDSKESYQLSFQ